VHRQARGRLDDANDLWQVSKIQHGVYSVRIKIHGDGDDIDVAGALAIAEQRAFDAGRACQ
jgi:hypothetical protein